MSPAFTGSMACATVQLLHYSGSTDTRGMADIDTRALTPLQAQDLRHVLVVPIAELNQPARQALAYARSLMQPVVAVHTAMDDTDETAFRSEWDEWAAEQQAALEQATEAARMAAETPSGWAEYAHMQALVKERPKVVVIQSPYRALVPPVVRYIEVLRDANPHRTVTVLLPEFVPAHWWEGLLHNQTALRLKLALYADPGVVVLSLPYHLPQ